MKTILAAKQVRNLDSIKGEIDRAEGPRASKALANVQGKYKALALVRGLGGNIFTLPQEKKFAVIHRCGTCGEATLTRTQDLWQTKGKCPQCRQKRAEPARATKPAARKGGRARPRLDPATGATVLVPAGK